MYVATGQNNFITRTDHTYINDCRSAPWLLQCDISNFTHTFIDTNTEHKETKKGLDSSAALFSPGKKQIHIFECTYPNGHCAGLNSGHN